ncbi:MAG TPA: UDP-glucose 4-epimerase GalE [Chloroflexi bacterium]|nr:UDP-glucose 4-epimerase GalE [Chloroflexota bacterium]
MNVFMTGGAGYIGSVTAEILLTSGHQVTIYDNLSRGNLAAIPSGAIYLNGDIGDRKTLRNALASANFDIVFHFASLIEAGESMEKPGLYFRTNVSYSNNVIELAAESGCNRFILSSTAAVYASSDQPLTEDSPIDPANVYGETKYIVERMLAWYQKIYGLRFAVLRYFNACGALPRQGEAHDPETHLIPRVLQVALGQADYVNLYGTDYPTPDGTCIRDYVHVADLAEAHLLAANALEDNDTLVYNLGSGIGYSNQEIIEMAREVTGHDIPVNSDDRRHGDATRLVASYEKIKHELGWEPVNSGLDNILRTAWEWHSKHSHLYDND